MNNASKSAMTAGILGIFLGVFGVHDWYLGRQKPAKRHVTLLIVGVVLFALSLVAQALISVVSQREWGNVLNAISTTLRLFGWLAVVGDVVWGIIEGILLLVQGDAGLVARGYVVPNTAGLANSVNPTPQQPASSVAQPPKVELPPTPTLAEQASNAPHPPQPVVFHSSNIASTTRPDLLKQPLSTQNVPMSPLTVAGKDGKNTINPVVLRKILIGAVVIIAVVVGGLFLKNGISSVLSKGYGETYRAAKALAPHITAAHQSQSCAYAAQYVDSPLVGNTDYDHYVTTCRDLVEGVKALVDQLGETPAMGWNNEISAQYQDFQALYNEAFPENNNLAAALQLYQAWHNYIVTADGLTVDSSEADFQRAAEVLRQSGNQTLQKYGEEWLAQQLSYLQAYRTYWETSYTDAEKETLRDQLNAQRVDLENWVADHRPDVTKLERLYVPDTEAMNASFTKLYDLIKQAYEQHYDRSSNDCNTAGDKVYCS